MAHILVIDLPGGNDADVLEAIIERGDEFTFLTSDLSLYHRQATIAPLLAKARHEIEVPGFDFNEILKTLSATLTRPLNAAICIVDIRMVMAAKIADHFRLPFLAPSVTMTLRDKFAVREKLAAARIGNQQFRLARSEQEMLQAIDEIGYPVVIKPCDGYASQNIVMLHGPEDLDPLISPIPSLAEQSTDYGLGVKANQRWIVEKYLQGSFIGVDMMTHAGTHYFVGLNEKIMFPRPSFAIRGGCFSPAHDDMKPIADFACSLLDALHYNHGASHLEIMLTQSGPQLVEINPRLVSAKIPRLMNLGLGRNVYNDLIDLHLGVIDFENLKTQKKFAVSRWLVADREGYLDRIQDAPIDHDAIGITEILKKKGDVLRPPFENTDRIGYVMTAHPDRHTAETIADQWVTQTQILYA